MTSLENELVQLACGGVTVASCSTVTDKRISFVLCVFPLLLLTALAVAIRSGEGVCDYHTNAAGLKDPETTAEAFASYLAMTGLLLGFYTDQLCVRYFGHRSFFDKDSDAQSMASMVYQACLGGMYGMIITALAESQGNLCTIGWKNPNDDYKHTFTGDFAFVGFLFLVGMVCMIRPLWIGAVSGKFWKMIFALSTLGVSEFVSRSARKVNEKKPTPMSFRNTSNEEAASEGTFPFTLPENAIVGQLIDTTVPEGYPSEGMRQIFHVPVGKGPGETIRVRIPQREDISFPVSPSKFSEAAARIAEAAAAGKHITVPVTVEVPQGYKNAGQSATVAVTQAEVDEGFLLSPMPGMACPMCGVSREDLSAAGGCACCVKCANMNWIAVIVTTGMIFYAVIIVLAAAGAMALGSPPGIFVALIFCGSYMIDEFVDMATPYSMSLLDAWRRKTYKVRAVFAALLLISIGSVDRVAFFFLPETADTVSWTICAGNVPFVPYWPLAVDNATWDFLLKSHYFDGNLTTRVELTASIPSPDERDTWYDALASGNPLPINLSPNKEISAFFPFLDDLGEATGITNPTDAFERLVLNCGEYYYVDYDYFDESCAPISSATALIEGYRGLGCCQTENEKCFQELPEADWEPTNLVSFACGQPAAVHFIPGDADYDLNQVFGVTRDAFTCRNRDGECSPDNGYTYYSSDSSCDSPDSYLDGSCCACMAMYLVDKTPACPVLGDPVVPDPLIVGFLVAGKVVIVMLLALTWKCCRCMRVAADPDNDLECRVCKKMPSAHTSLIQQMKTAIAKDFKDKYPDETFPGSGKTCKVQGDVVLATKSTGSGAAPDVIDLDDAQTGGGGLDGSSAGALPKTPNTQIVPDSAGGTGLVTGLVAEGPFRVPDSEQGAPPRQPAEAVLEEKDADSSASEAGVELAGRKAEDDRIRDTAATKGTGAFDAQTREAAPGHLKSP